MAFWEKLRDNILHPIRDFVFDPANVGTAVGFALGGPPGAAAGRALGNAADRIGEKYLDTGKGLREADPITLGSSAKHAGTGFAVGHAANMAAPHLSRFADSLGLGADPLAGAAESAASVTEGTASAAGALPEPKVAMVDSMGVTKAAGVPAPAAPAAPSPVPAAASAATKSGGGFSSALGMDDLSTFEKLYLGNQAVQAGANLYGAYQEGKEADRLRREEEERKRARSELIRQFLSNPDRFGL